jgi:hypothetical protein
VDVQRQLSFLETTPAENDTAVWDARDGEARAEALVILARLIAKVITDRNEVEVSNGEEGHDD